MQSSENELFDGYNLKFPFFLMLQVIMFIYCRCVSAGTLCIYGYMNVSAAGPMPVMEELVSTRWGLINFDVFLITGVLMLKTLNAALYCSSIATCSVNCAFTDDWFSYIYLQYLTHAYVLTFSRAQRYGGVLGPLWRWGGGKKPQKFWDNFEKCLRKNWDPKVVILQERKNRNSHN